MAFDRSAVEHDLSLFRELGLLAEHEIEQVLEVFSKQFPFSNVMELAESVHVHVNVDSVDELPKAATLVAAGAEASSTAQERKFAFASGVNVILASEPTAQDELIPGAVVQPKPYVDHLGIDLRDESGETKSVFDSVPALATQTGWRHVYQAGPVRCCHVEMGPKHWVYPPEGPMGMRRPIEFAFGELKSTTEYIGCDYRPIDPAHPLAGAAERITAGDMSATTALAPSVSTTIQAVRPTKLYIFEECTCNTSPSRPLLDFFTQRYGADVDVRAFDLAKPEGLLPLPPALFLALQNQGSIVLPALVVDGEVRAQGWLPNLMDAVTLVEGSPEARSRIKEQPATVSAGSCCTTEDCC